MPTFYDAFSSDAGNGVMPFRQHVPAESRVQPVKADRDDSDNGGYPDNGDRQTKVSERTGVGVKHGLRGHQ